MILNEPGLHIHSKVGGEGGRQNEREGGEKGAKGKRLEIGREWDEKGKMKEREREREREREKGRG